jgi:hypothetical protein
VNTIPAKPWLAITGNPVNSKLLLGLYVLSPKLSLEIDIFVMSLPPFEIAGVKRVCEWC